MGAVLSSPVERKPLSPQERQEILVERFRKKRADFILRTLTEDELRIIDSYGRPDPIEYLLAAKTKQILSDAALTARFDSVVVRDKTEYMRVQTSWYRREEYLVGTQIQRKPTFPEVLTDFNRNGNGSRFHIYYCLKNFFRNSKNFDWN